MKSKKFYSIAIAAITTLTLVSCEKEKEASVINSLNAKTGHSDIPYFEDVDAVFNAIETAIAFDSLPELIAYETSQGRQSIGAISDAFYENIDFESFTNQCQALTYYNNNSNYLDTNYENGEICITPKWFYTPFRYVTNEDGLFAVGDNVCKLFKSTIVSTRIDHLDDLITLSESSLDDLDTSIFYLGGNTSASEDIHPECEYNWIIGDTVMDEDNRLILKLSTSSIHMPNTPNFVITSILTYSSHKWIGLWWPEKHTITCQGDVTIHKKLVPRIGN